MGFGLECQLIRESLSLTDELQTMQLDPETPKAFNGEAVYTKMSTCIVKVICRILVKSLAIIRAARSCQ